MCIMPASAGRHARCNRSPPLRSTCSTFVNSAVRPVLPDSNEQSTSAKRGCIVILAVPGGYDRGDLTFPLSIAPPNRRRESAKKKDP